MEVLAALVILGGSVTTLLVAQSRTLGQLEDSRRELLARHLAKELITEWELSDESCSTSASGSFVNHTGWSWRRTSQVVEVAEGVRATQVMLQLAFATKSGRDAWTREYRWLVEEEANARQATP